MSRTPSKPSPSQLRVLQAVAAAGGRVQRPPEGPVENCIRDGWLAPWSFLGVRLTPTGQKFVRDKIPQT